MFSSRLYRSGKLLAPGNLRTALQPIPTCKPAYSVRPLTLSTKLYKEDKRSPTEKLIHESDHSHAGSFSRTDNTVSIEYPGEDLEPTSAPVQGRGGMHFKRTLASFSLEGRVGIVTGGARGLGLVMSQALVISGCDVAIVDLNSKCPIFPANVAFVLTLYQRKKANVRRRSSWSTSPSKIQELILPGNLPNYRETACFPTHIRLESLWSPRTTPMYQTQTPSTLHLKRLSETMARSIT